MAEYRNVAQYQDQAFAWDPAQRVWSGGIQETSPGYLPMLFQFQQLVRSGQARDYEAEQYRNWEQAARAIPTRDISTLTAGWQGQYGGQWLEDTWQEGNPDWWSTLDPLSPDVGPIMLQLKDKLDAGTATRHEREIYSQVMGMAGDWNYRASVPQASDAFNPLGDNLFGALGTLALGATGGLAAAPLFAGGAGLATTLGSLGTLSGLAGTGASVLGGATGQDWLSTAGLGLGALGGILGGVGGLSSLWGTGVQSLGDAARLASSAGKITGALGSASGNDALRQASRYLGQAGQLGQFGAGVLPSSFTDWSGDNAPWAANVAPQSGVSNLLSAADRATQRGGGMEWDYSNEWGGGGYSEPIGPGLGWDYSSNPAYQQFIGWGGDETQMPWYQGADLDTSAGSGGWLSSVLGGLGQAGTFLGSNASWLGPAASALGGLGAGALGSRASADAARLQADALNRGIDLQTAQWLQSQANQAPWLEAGRDALGELRWRLGHEEATPPEQRAAIRGSDYAMPGATPGWSPSTYAGYTPTDVPSAAGYRYTPGGVPQASQYRYTPGAVPTLSGQALLANDPGVQFRLDEGRRALEASAAARGGLTSGATLSALQRQGQELSSQEYANAWNRASQQAQLREQWGQAASQLGWSQAEAETRLREMLAQTAGAQNWQQALQEANARAQQQQFGWTSGFTAQQQGQREREAYDTSLYNRLMEQNKLTYGRDVYTNETDEARRQQLYNQQVAEMVRQWNQASGLAQTGQLSAGQLGTQGAANNQQMASLLTQLGTAGSQGVLNQANSWQNALQNVGGAAQGYFGNQAYMQGLQSILSGLNR